MTDLLTDAEVLAALDADELNIAASNAKHEANNRLIKEVCEVSTRKHYQSINKRKNHE